jgi:hypothetical protein
MVTAVHMRSVVGFVLSLQDIGNPGSQPAQYLIVGIDDNPFFLYRILIRRNRFIT